MKKNLLLLFIVPLLSFGQCVSGNCIDGIGTAIYSNGDKYVGEFTNGIPNGKGVMNFMDGDEFSGTWINGKFVDGELYLSKTGDVANGKFKDGRLIDGKYTFGKNGSWEDGKFNQDGELVDGRRFAYLETGGNCYFDYEDGRLINKVCNYQNQYNPDDIIRGPESIKIDLMRNDDLNKTDDAFFLNLIINNRKVRFHFDTGASTFTMNLTQWEKLKYGLKYEDLKIFSTADAVGSMQTTKFYKILEPIQIDEFLIKNIIVSVVQIKTPDDPDNDNLIGIGFFKKFSNVIWNMNDQSIQLYK